MTTPKMISEVKSPGAAWKDSIASDLVLEDWLKGIRIEAKSENHGLLTC